MMNKIKLFHFGDCGSYDELNPFYIVEKKYAREILFLIADNIPFTLKISDIARLLNCKSTDIKSILNKMKNIEMILELEGVYSINFPVFLGKDLYLIDGFIRRISKKIGDLIITQNHKLLPLVAKLNSYKNFSENRLLYHIIGDYIFDGTAIDYFSNREIFSISKVQPGNRNYILIGFEDSKKALDFSSNILCSSNNYNIEGVRFNSFGDSNGNRKDFYRFFRQVNSCLKNVTNDESLNLSYIKLIESKNEELARNCAFFIKKALNKDIVIKELSYTDKNTFNFLKELDYIKINKDYEVIFNVPVFYDEDFNIMNEISDFILSIIEVDIKKVFKMLNSDFKELSAIKHNIDIKEIANELWHQVFGNINEYLVKEGFYQTPEYIEGQGRFLKSIYIKS